MENKYRIYVSLAEGEQDYVVSEKLTEDDIKEVDTVLGKLLISSGSGYLKMPGVHGEVYIPLDVLKRSVIRVVPT